MRQVGGSEDCPLMGTFREHFTFHYLAGQGALQGVKPERVSAVRG